MQDTCFRKKARKQNCQNEFIFQHWIKILWINKFWILQWSRKSSHPRTDHHDPCQWVHYTWGRSVWTPWRPSCRRGPDSNHTSCTRLRWIHMPPKHSSPSWTPPWWPQTPRRTDRRLWRACRRWSRPCRRGWYSVHYCWSPRSMYLNYLLFSSWW